MEGRKIAKQRGGRLFVSSVFFSPPEYGGGYNLYLFRLAQVTSNLEITVTEGRGV